MTALLIGLYGGFLVILGLLVGYSIGIKHKEDPN